MLAKNLPNYLTLINLAAGISAILLTIQGEWYGVIICVGISLIADLLDGFTARLLKVSGPMGVQLDSLADLVSFGVMPAVFLITLLDSEGLLNSGFLFLAASGIVYALCACWRLAKFNITENKKNDFSGLPSPAAGLFILSFGLVIISEQEWIKEPFIFGIILFLTIGLLMVSNIRFLSLKFSRAGHKANLFRYVILLTTPIPLFFLGFPGVFISMTIYFLLSILSNLFPLD